MKTQGLQAGDEELSFEKQQKAGSLWCGLLNISPNFNASYVSPILSYLKTQWSGHILFISNQ